MKENGGVNFAEVCANVMKAHLKKKFKSQRKCQTQRNNEEQKKYFKNKIMKNPRKSPDVRFHLVVYYVWRCRRFSRGNRCMKNNGPKLSRVEFR